MQSLVSVRMDEALKNNFDFICNELGMNMTTAITIFAKKVCREKRIPFDVSIDKSFEGGNAMRNQTKYHVELWPELSIKNEDIVRSSFSELNAAIEYLKEKSNEMEQMFLRSEEEEYEKSCVMFAISIEDVLNAHTRMVVFDYEGLGYVYDNRRTEIPYSDETNTDIFDIVYGYICALTAR